MNLNNFGKKLKIKQRPEEVVSEEEIFIRTINSIIKGWTKSNELYNQFQINIIEYEEDYFQIIEDLILIKYGLWRTEIILWFVFGRVDVDGKVYPLILEHKDKDDEKIYLNTSNELWKFLIKLEEQRKQDEK
jgi:hypothetical protein